MNKDEIIALLQEQISFLQEQLQEANRKADVLLEEVTSLRNMLERKSEEEAKQKRIRECHHYAIEDQMLPLPTTAGNLFLPMTTDQPALQSEPCDILSGVSLVFPDGTQVNIKRGSAQAVMSFLKLYQREDLPCLD